MKCDIYKILSEVRAKANCIPSSFEPLKKWLLQCCDRIEEAHKYSVRNLLDAAERENEKLKRDIAWLRKKLEATE